MYSRKSFLWIALTFLLTASQVMAGKIDPKTWFPKVRFHLWEQTTGERKFKLLFYDRRYFLIQGKKTLYDQGEVVVLHVPVKLKMYNRYGENTIQVTSVGNDSISLKGQLRLKYEIIKLDGKFTKSKSPIGAPKPTDIHAAATWGDVNAASKLVKSKAAVDQLSKSGLPPVSSAALHHHNQMVSFLLKKAADPNKLSSKGYPPLYYAIRSEDYLSAKYLIDAGANVKFSDKEGVNLLFRALERNSLDMVELLVKKGVDVNTTDKYGNNALKRAMSTYSIGGNKIIERLSYTKYLIEKAGYDPRRTDAKGRTALFYAANLGLAETVKYLLSKGLNPNQKDAQGKTVFDYIAESDRKHLVMPILAKHKK